MRSHLNMFVTLAGAASVIGALVYWTDLQVRSPVHPDPNTGQIYFISLGKMTHRYVTADERRNYYISWGALIAGATVVTAIQKGAWDFSGKNS
jgi:uncharacterized RDD family membrane protein YckC